MTGGRTVPRWGIVAAVGLALVVGTILLARGWDADPGQGVVAELRPAVAPFTGLTAGRVRVGTRTLPVVVADSLPERERGLRGLGDPAPYAGMLFVFGADTEASFTMADVPEPLDVVFYAADGRPVARRTMAPCAGTDATCPIHSAGRPFRYALETASGEAPAGDLAVGRVVGRVAGPATGRRSAGSGVTPRP